MSDTKRAPVQCSQNWYRSRGREGRPAGTIDWAEHAEVWKRYAERYGRGQSAEELARRGGFSHDEIEEFLGHAAKTFEPYRSSQ